MIVEPLLRALTQVVTRHPRKIVVAVTLLTLGALAALSAFELEPDLENLLPPDHPGVELRQQLEGDGGAQRTLLVAIESAHPETLIPAVAASLESSPYLELVVATRDQFLSGWTKALENAPLSSLPPETLARLEARLIGDERATVLGELPARIAEDPFLGMQLARRDPLGLRTIFDDVAKQAMPASLDPNSPYLVTRNGRIGFVRAVGTKKPYDSTFTHTLLDDIDLRIEQVRAETGLEFDTRLIGSYAAARSDEARIKRDLWWSCFGAITLIFIFLTLSTRSRLDPPLLLFPTSLVILWTLAFGNLLFGPITSLATCAAPILSGLSVDIAIHYVGRFRAEQLRADLPTAIARTTRGVGGPLFAGMLTSVAAFASLTFTQFGGFVDFGGLLALGLVLAFVLSVLTLPLLLAARRDRPQSTQPAQPDRPGPVLGAIERCVASRLGAPAAALLLVIALAGWAAIAHFGLEFDADPRRLRPHDDPVLESTAWLEDALGFSPLPITVLVPTDLSLDEGHVALARLDASAAPPVAFSLGPHRLAPAPSRRAAINAFRSRTAGWVEGALEDLDRAGLNPAPFAGTLRQLDTQLRTPPPPPETVPIATVEWRDTQYWRYTLFPERAHWQSTDRVQFDRELRNAFGPDGDEIVTVAPLGLADDLTSLLTDDLLRSASIATIAVLLIVLLLSGVRFGLIAIIPTVVGVGVTLGGMALLALPIHLGNVVALPFLIGLGIDDGIHMVSKHREGASRRELLASSGRSVWRTSVTSLIGFGSLAFASSPGLASLGLVMAVGITACFVASVITLPVILSHPIFRVDPAESSTP
ncbi:MAG: MMPL family transporter [Planctomycetota bacterium]